MCGDGAFVPILVRMGGEWEVAIDELRDLDDGRGLARVGAGIPPQRRRDAEEDAEGRGNQTKTTQRERRGSRGIELG